MPAHFVRIFFAVIIANSLALPRLDAAEVPDQLLQFRKERVELTTELVRAARLCVRRQDTSHPAFHGCIDWHSAVHGIWALVAASEITGDRKFLEEAKSLLDPAALSKELEFIRTRPEFELPYGRAWFLRLAVDFARLTSDQRLRPLATEIARSLADNYLSHPLRVELKSYDSAIWAVINLHYYATFVGDEELLNRIATRVVNDLVPIDGECPMLEREMRSADFMAICTNWAWLVAEHIDGPEFKRWSAKFLPDVSRLQVVIAPRRAHEYGANFSRAWGLWESYEKTGDLQYLASYLQHVSAGMDSWRAEVDDYGRVGHWVAQFGILAIHQSLADYP